MRCSCDGRAFNWKPQRKFPFPRAERGMNLQMRRRSRTRARPRLPCWACALGPEICGSAARCAPKIAPLLPPLPSPSKLFRALGKTMPPRRELGPRPDGPRGTGESKESVRNQYGIKTESAQLRPLILAESKESIRNQYGIKGGIGAGTRICQNGENCQNGNQNPRREALFPRIHCGGSAARARRATSLVQRGALSAFRASGMFSGRYPRGALAYCAFACSWRAV